MIKKLKIKRVKLEKLIDKTNVQLKEFLKEVIFDQTLVFDWLNFFNTYINFENNSITDFENRINRTFDNVIDINFIENMNNEICIIESINHSIHGQFNRYHSKVESIDIGIYNNRLNFSMLYKIEKELLLKTFFTADKDKINEFMYFIYENIKLILNSMNILNLNEITDFFEDILPQNREKNDTLEVINRLM